MKSVLTTIALCLFGVGTLITHAQAPDPHATATVHLFRTGSEGNTIQILADGAPILKIGDRELVTFTLFPGRHQISASYGGQEPNLTINFRTGQEYFVHLAMDAHRSALFMGAVKGTIALTLTEETGAAEGLHERQLSAEDQNFILSQTLYAAHSQTITAAPIAVRAPAAALQPTDPAPASPAPTQAAARFEALSSQHAYRVKYAGGTIADATVGRSLQLRIASAAIELGDLRIPPGAVTSIVLSQDKHHRIGTGIAISMVTLGAGVPVMFSKSTKDFIQITWNDGGQRGGAAFQADKNEYRGILAALEGVTGKAATTAAEK